MYLQIVSIGLVENYVRSQGLEFIAIKKILNWEVLSQRNCAELER